MLRKLFIGLAVSATVAGAGYVGALYNETQHQVDILHCPIGQSEDSCKMDYVGQGAWRLVPQHP